MQNDLAQSSRNTSNYRLERSTSTETVVLIDETDKEEPLLFIQDDDNQSRRSVVIESRLAFCCQGIKSKTSSFLDIYTDQSGSCRNIFVGMLPLFIVGGFLGIFMPKNSNLPTSAYRLVSSIIGYSSFVCWSVSFYPQIIINYQLKSVVGLSIDAQVFAWLNYLCYAMLSSALVWNQDMKDNSKNMNGPDINTSIRSKELVNSIQSLLFTTILICQIIQYRGPNVNTVSVVTIGLVTTIALFCVTYVAGIFVYPSACYW
eukprot:CAMPEP_0197824246 /NCGR_PEP_ID=MMETSP1437-20131217/1520_1 /TAXON_ID=49252 ORGANISM="Eucampia antarctica, Strain CCMP1452" /NCGR_SAMPLE_ID=MMETSP1437 /ASSEMBLY_ACC=CAM_ASM_001096 /LENGTH=258 /DNA_ID=CAMNT_0043423793 /DNA_START=60 /DNA_END=833 /DNA_ORIENTATION=+